MQSQLDKFIYAQKYIGGRLITFIAMTFQTVFTIFTRSIYVATCPIATLRTS